MTSHLIVVGGGIIGGSIAWRAARLRLAVTLIEAGSFAREATWAGAGMLAPGGEYGKPDKWAGAAVASAAAYPAFVEELAADSGCPIDYRASGAIDLDVDDARAAAQGAIGILSEPAMWRGQPARYFPNDAIVNPRDIASALLAAFHRHGVEVREHERVVSIEDNLVTTDAGTYATDAIVIAAGAWSSSIAGLGAPPPSYPVRGHLIGYRAQPGLLDPIVRRGHTYLLQRSNGFLIAGASTEHVGFDRAVDSGIGDSLARAAASLLPDLAQLTPAEVWTGFRPGASEPVVRRVEGRPIWLAYGHYRNGILLAPWTAEQTVTSIAGR